MVKKRIRLISLIIGVSLWLLYFFYLGRHPLPIYSFIKSGILSSITGLGTALIIYSIKGRVACKWASILLAIIVAIGYLISNTLPPVLPGHFISIISYKTLPFTLTFWLIKKSIKWKLPSVYIIALLLFSYQFAISMGSLRLKADPSDTFMRDEVYVKNGWTLCEELYLNSTKPRHYVVTWSKQFRGDESFACYLKVKIPEGSKPVFATFALTLSIERHKVPEGGEFIPFYHSEGLRFNLEDILRRPPQPYQFYEGSHVIGVTRLSGELNKDTEVIERVDIYFSYKPSRFLPEYYSTDVVTEVKVKFEVNILWEV